MLLKGTECVLRMPHLDARSQWGEKNKNNWTRTIIFHGWTELKANKLQRNNPNLDIHEGDIEYFRW